MALANTVPSEQLDLLLINPGGRDKIYQNLGSSLTAIEPPLWCRLIAGYARDRGYTIQILDSRPRRWGRSVWRNRCARLRRV